MRLGLGPVFAWEWRLAARRWPMYAGRTAFVGILLAVLALTWLSVEPARERGSIQAQAQVGEAFFQTIAATQLALVLLAAPAATAGAICLDKARGTMMHVLMTDLSDSEIVLGKLAARLWPALGLVACTLGVMSVATWLGGIDPMALVGAFLVTIGVAVLSCAVALLFSVWATKTTEALLATYGIWIVWLLAVPIWFLLMELRVPVGLPPAWLSNLNPFWVVANVQRGAVDLMPHATYLAVCVALSVGLAAVATWRVRPVSIRQSSRPAKIKTRRRLRDRRFVRSWLWRLIPSPSLDSNPVLWREWHRRRPSGWVRVIWGLYSTAALGFSGLVIWACISNFGPGAEVGLVMVNLGIVGLGLLFLSVSASTALAEERVQGSLDVLVSTPMSSSAILWGKWLGTFRTAWPLTVLPAINMTAAILLLDRRTLGRDPPPSFAPWVILVLAALSILAYGAALSSLGLALATWTKRLGRAVGITVTAYVFMSIAWLALCMVLSSSEEVGMGPALGSPLMHIAFSSIAAIDGDRQGIWIVVIAWGFFWLVAYISVAAVLFLATRATFDRCLGRMPEAPASPVPAPVASSKPKAAPEPLLVGP